MIFDQNGPNLLLKHHKTYNERVNDHLPLSVGCGGRERSSECALFQDIPLASELVGTTSDREMVKTQLYVDDCAQSSRDKCGGIVHNRLGNSFYIVHKMNRRLKLTVSDKGVIVANCPKLAERLQIELLKLHGIKYKIKKSTGDLGVSYTAGTCKPNQSLLERLHGKEV